MASGRSKHLTLDGKLREAALRGLIETWLDGLEEEVARLGHVARGWDLPLAAMERRRTGGLRAVRRKTGVRLAGYQSPRKLRERSA